MPSWEELKKFVKDLLAKIEDSFQNKKVGDATQSCSTPGDQSCSNPDDQTIDEPEKTPPKIG